MVDVFCAERRPCWEFHTRDRDPEHCGDQQPSLERESPRTTQMKIVIQKLNGLWHLIVGSCQIRTPFLDTQDRALVVTYARRAYPGARIFQRD